MLYEVNFILNLSLIEYFLIGLGIGIAFYYMFYDNNSSTETNPYFLQQTVGKIPKLTNLRRSLTT